jgi:hypothetical protein
MGICVGWTTAVFGTCSIMENSRGRGGPVGVSGEAEGSRLLPGCSFPSSVCEVTATQSNCDI